jgi:hypothetical protein
MDLASVYDRPLGGPAIRSEVDRSTITRPREVAKQGALVSLAESRPGTCSKEQDLELAQANAEAGRRSRSWPSSCCWWREKGVGAEWPGPTQALERAGLLDLVAARPDGLIDTSVDDPARPTRLATSDNGPQRTSGSSRAFMALCAIHQHFGRPGTPTDQALIESLFPHVKAEWSRLTKIRDPATLRAELAEVRERYKGVRLHTDIGYVTPNDEHEGPTIRKGLVNRPLLQ